MINSILSFQVKPDRWMRRLGTCLTILMISMLWMGSAIALDPSTPTPTQAISQPLVPQQSVENSGAKLFEAQCAGCHAGGGNIIRRGKNLKLKTLQKNKIDTLEAIAALVTQGKGNMSAYADRITPEEIQTVSAYVLSQASSNWK
jgi:cytochrome c6